MGFNDAASEIQRLLLAQRAAWIGRDADAVAAGFAEDAVFTSPVATYTGRSAIRQAAADFFAYAARIEIDVKRILTAGNKGVIEWHWLEEAAEDGQVRTAADAIVFEVRDGLFVAWREYINWHGG
ncbi:MAG: nuclear transport factor 2 family protein [Planctomycetota bacterium]